MQIKSLNESEEQDLLAFLLAQGNDLSLQQLTGFNIKNPGLTQLAWQNNEIIGCVLVSFDGLRGYFQNLVVDKKFRGAGYGQELVSAGIRALQAQGCHEVVVLCRPEMSSWYEKQGFVASERAIYLKTI